MVVSHSAEPENAIYRSIRTAMEMEAFQACSRCMSIFVKASNGTVGSENYPDS